MSRIILIIFIIFLLLVVGATIFFTWERKERTPEIATPEVGPEEEIIPEIPADWKIYRNEEDGFEFRYPPDFELYFEDEKREVPGYVKIIKYDYPYHFPIGDDYWVLPKNIKDNISFSSSCGPLKAVEDIYEMPYRVPYFISPSTCKAIKYSDKVVIAYGIDKGVVFEGLSFLESKILIFQDDQAILISEILPPYPKEIRSAMEEFVAKHGKPDFATPDWINLNIIVNNLLEKEIVPPKLTKHLQLLEKIVKTLQFVEL